ncbi:NADH dehydrogenase [ubiquinone] flavoprotein 3, mitochondrial [Thalassophryne amazonica]|uniref:NADH dehydrogenase [ubiquinone] flavoprotein 3, mitochondrial n=1 Tax=Thalassophryne amazonica TaxID=390379 RepID=UPI00147184B6|nr:NADH dehydrogenase [ubiquinone] flavoprotein 3, mitochondrial [Thalassophryne amazonica]
MAEDPKHARFVVSTRNIILAEGNGDYLIAFGATWFCQGLQLERLVILRNYPAALCTQAGKPTKPEKKAKPTSKKAAVAAAAPPEPEEPFDNSTYRNNQHHSYTPFTFVDMDVEMSKYRLPQPSTGRPSPRH